MMLGVKMPKTEPFTPGEYHKNVYRQLELSTQHRKLVLTHDDTRREKVHTELKKLQEEYNHRLPIVQLSRCPYCNEPLLRQFDSYDLNGEWWHPLRPDYDIPKTCEHFFVLQGALNLNGRIPVEVQSKDSIYPGPEVPFVIPRLLEMAGMVAVIHKLAVGEHYTAYPIAYFTTQMPEPSERTQSWCRTTYALDKVFWSSRIEHFDYALTPWLRRGKIYWINADSPNLPVVHETLERYPFKDVSGRKFMLCIRKGEAIAAAIKE
jgi:hypothetical protein